MTKRILSFLMALCLVFGMALPGVVSADVPKSIITLHVIDDSGNPIAGVTYVLTQDGVTLQQGTSGSNGLIQFTEVPVEVDYVIKETSVPSEYTAKGDAGNISIMPSADNHDIDVVYEAPDPIGGRIQVDARDTGGNPVAGAVFTVEVTGTGEIVDTITTDGNGYAITEWLAAGHYYVKEQSVPSPYINVNLHEVAYIESDDQVVAFEVTYDMADPFTNNVRVQKVDGEGNPLSGVVFGVYKADGTKVEEITTNSYGYAKSSMLYEGQYYVLELQGLDGYETDTEKHYFIITENQPVMDDIVVVNARIPDIKGTVTVNKTDDSGNPLSGAKFGIYDSGNVKLQEITSGSDGKAISGELAEGDYYVKELEAPQGYIMDSAQHSFSIHAGNTEPTVSISNTAITGKVKVIKTDTNNAPLSGVVFHVCDASSNAILDIITTGVDGSATSKTLDYGNYYVKEVTPADGYELNDTPVSFSIMEHDKTVELRLSNSLIMGAVKIIKIDESDGQRLSGAVFALYNSQGQELAKLTTDSNGEASYSGLTKGDYSLKEITAPESYVLSTIATGFSITEQGQTVEKTLGNKKGYATLKITKTGENSVKLSGVIFEIYLKSTGKLLSTVTTDSNGKVSVSLPLGKYELKETKTLDDYQLLEDAVEFELTEDASTVQLTVENEKKATEYGYIKLTKTDSADSNTKLQGAVFGIYAESSSEKVAEMTTGTDGIVTSAAIPVGSYYLLELTAPQGYTLSDTKHAVKVETDKTLEITITNTLLPADKGVLQIIKTDKDNALLPGAVFAVYNSSGSKVADLTTGAEGMASLELDAGQYTVQETTAPDDYVLSSEKQSVTIVAGNTQSITVINEKQVENLQIIKSASGTGEKLQGAVFAIYKEGSTEKLAELTTDSSGLASMKLEPGDYFMLELTAPTGYVPEKAKISFTIQSRDEVVKVEVTNIKQDTLESTVKDDSDGSTGSISIPKTGQSYPAAQYAVATMLLLGAVGLMGTAVFTLRKHYAIA